MIPPGTWNVGSGVTLGGGACGLIMRGVTGINPTIDRYGIRFSRGAGGYNNHNRHVFDGPNFELRQLDPNVAIPLLNQTSGSAIIARNMRMEAWPCGWRCR